MPRAQSQTGSTAGPSSQTPLLLKRNQACHQCRRRKLRCDAQKPCSTCVRSHRFAAASNPALLSTEPECTYDDLASDGTPVVKPRTKYKALEDRIGELEDLLKQQLAQNTDTRPVGNATTSSSTTKPPSELTLPNHPTIVISESDLFSLGNHFEISPNPSQGQASTPSTHSRETASVDTTQQLLASNWPPLLPRPELLHHLVDVFFNCHPHGRYLLHRPSFMIALTLSPKTTNFPHVSLLHAICAYAGVFSYLVEPPPGPDLKNLGNDFIFGERRLGKYRREESFSEYHARLANETLEESLNMGFNMLECAQASAILTGFYHMQGRWVDLWIASAHFFRLAVPLGLPARIGYRADGTIPDPNVLPDGTESLLPEATSPIEREQRVNLLWIGYVNDRFVSAPASWALSIDDQDIHQVFPCDLARFEAGYGIDHEGSRQSIDSPDVLFQHFPETTDSFTLYIKGAILISKTKTFNQRIRHKHPGAKDIRELPEFHQLEKEINMFKKSFPLRCQAPIVETSRGLDVHVYTAHLIPHYATLWLHERLRDSRSPNCLSVQKTTTAARAVLDLVYAVCSTSFDITRLPIMCPHAWHKAGSSLVNLFKLELSRGRQEEALAIDMEIQAIRFALGQMGARIPMALRYNNSLDFDIHQGQISQLSYSISQQSLPPDPTSKSHLSPSSTTSSKSPGMKSPNGGSHEEIRAFTSFTSNPVEQNLFTETSLFAPGATRVDGSLLPLLDPEPAPADEFESFGNHSF